MVLGGSAWSSPGSTPGAVCRFVSPRGADPPRPDAAPLRRAVSEVGLGRKGEKERAEKLQQAVVGDKRAQRASCAPHSAPFVAGWVAKGFRSGGSPKPPPSLRRNPIAELTLHSAGLGFLISAGFFTYNEDYGLIPASQGGAVGIKRVRAHT